MDREELEESSSSQNDNLSIKSIKRGAKKKDICLFSDGSSFLLPEGFAGKNNLYPGKELDSSNILLLEKKASLYSAELKCLEFLGVREHTAAQLEQKLLKRGYRLEIIQEVLDTLQAEGSLDEERFSITWIHSRLNRHPEGMLKLKAGLMKAGVQRSLAERVLSGQINEDEQRNILKRAAEKIEKRNPGNEKKLIKKLYSQGFSYKQVINYIESLH